MIHSPVRGLVHLIEEVAELRQQLAASLRDLGYMAVVYERAAPFLDILPTLSPGCVVSNIDSPDMEGLSLLRTVKASGRPLPVILLTADGEVPLAVEAMKLGAADFLQLPVDPERLRKAVADALKEAEVLGVAQDFRVYLARLTPRERQVFDLVVLGESNKSIARHLNISPRTVEIYRANVMLKMHAENISDLIRTAVRSGAI